MVRNRLPSATYYSPVGESEWSRETFCERPVAVHSGNYRNPIEIARHVADHVSSPLPFFVMDVAGVQHRIDVLRAACPRLRASYAVSCNADPVLARILANNDDVIFSVANTAELEMATTNVESWRVMLCSQLLTRKTIRSAAQLDSGIVVVENEKQLQDALANAPNAQILLAVNMSRSTCEVPFGCEEQVLPDMLALAALLNANLIGIFYDIGSNASTESHSYALREVRDIFDAAAAHGIVMSRVAIGSLSLPASDLTGHDFVTTCLSLNRAIDDAFPSSFGHVDVFADVTRFLVTNSFALCTTVIGKRALDAKFITNDDFDDGVGFVYQTNDGVYGSFGCRQMDINPYCKPLHTSDIDDLCEPQHFGTVLGSSLECNDVAQKLLRSRQLRVGEWLVWEQMGAFTIPSDSEHPVPPVYYYSGKECWEKLINKDVSRRSPSPLRESDETGSCCEGDYASTTDSESDCGDTVFPSNDVDVDEIYPSDDFYMGY